MTRDDFAVAGDGTLMVNVEALGRWLRGLESSIEAECLGAPAGCNEAKAYLYGEICALKLIAKQVDSWNATFAGGNQGAEEPAKASSASEAL